MTTGISRTSNSQSISAAEARLLLGRLCAEYGFCLSALWNARLENNPPHSVAKFTDTVFRAEGLDPTTADSALYNAVHGEVKKAFERSAGNHEAQ